MIKYLIILSAFQVFSLCDAYDFACPSQAHWDLRATSMCLHQRNYSCLFDVNLQINVYRDKCIRSRIVGKGYKYVFQPNPNRQSCSRSRFQPFIFNTTGYSDCAFLKSLCSGNGQKIHTDGTTRSDRTCSCNTEKGFTFVHSPKNGCYCNLYGEDSDDCSCYLRFNRTIIRKDLRCFETINIVSSRSDEDALNKSEVLKNDDFDNFKYNIACPTNEYRTKAVVCVIIIVTFYLLVIGIYIPQRFKRQKLKNETKNQCNRLMQSNETTEKRHFVRIMIVGKQSAGKTCLMRRLLKESTDGVSSTDGIDIVVRRCKINMETGEWKIGKNIGDDKVNRILKAHISKERTTTERNRSGNSESNKETVYDKDVTKADAATDETEEDKQTKSSVSENVLQHNENHKDIEVKHTASLPDTEINVEVVQNINTDQTPEGNTSYHDTNTDKDLEENKEKCESSSLKLPAELMDNYLSQTTGDIPSIHYALCELWDFAGQREFYATHQAFLTSKAVYIVVADMEDTIDKQNINQYISFTDYKNVGEYVDFWYDSIHCYRTNDELENDQLNPPILLVFTGADKYNKEQLKERISELDAQLNSVLGGQNKYKHYRDKFYLSNTKGFDEDFEKLRTSIFEASTQIDDWGKSFPLKWILLEHSIEIIKNSGRNFISLKEMFQMASHPEIEITKPDDMSFFLRFQHNVGNIIFFENIPDLVILKPQWLVDAFRCLVSHINDEKLHNHKDWTQLSKHGKISESLITQLFQSKHGTHFSGQKVNLKKIMEKLDILVKIRDSDFYIMPSKMPSFPFDTVCNDIGIHSCRRSSWLCLKFQFLPPSFFNHVSAWYIRKYESSEMDKDRESLALCRGICVFDFDELRCEKILLTMSTNTIALQILSFSKQQKEFGGTCSAVYNELKLCIQDIKKKYPLKISFELHFKCSTGHFYQNTMLYQDLKRISECYCPQHKSTHQSEEIYLPWMENKEASGDSYRLNNTAEKKDKDIQLPWQVDGDEFQRMLSHGTYLSYDNRLTLGGPCEAGKSSLASLLIGKEIPLKRNLKDGIGIYFGKNGIDIEKKKMVRLHGGEHKQEVLAKILLPTLFDNKESERITKQETTLQSEILEEVRNGRYSTKIASSDLIDFGGHISYDLTNQLNMPHRGSFLLMFDGRFGLNDQLDEYSKGVTAAVIFTRWVDSVLNNTEDNEENMPMILFAATHRDLCKKDVAELKGGFIRDIKQIFSLHKKRHHIYLDDVFFINGIDQSDPEIQRMTHQVVMFAMQQSSWGQRQPMQWVPLELQISNMRMNNIIFITKDDLFNVNMLNGNLALTDNQLNDFLLTQHSLGKLVYYHLPGLDNFIIIQPPALVNILRSFVTDEKCYPDDPHIESILQTLNETGKIYHRDLFKVWQQENFHQYMQDASVKEFVLKLLVHLNILIISKKLKQSPNDMYLVPCMIKTIRPDFDNMKHKENKTICLEYSFTKNSIPNALAYKVIGAVMMAWPLKEENKKTCLYHMAAILNVSENDELRIWSEDNRIKANLTNQRSLLNISPDVAASIQECLTKIIESSLLLYLNSLGKKIKPTAVSELYTLSLGVPCGKSVCFKSIHDVKKADSWKCDRDKTHNTKYLLYWIFDKSQKMCAADCKGLSNDELRTQPSNKHLVRLGSQIDMCVFKEFCIHLGMAIIQWENTVDMYGSHGREGIMFMALFKWKLSKLYNLEEPSLKDIEDALIATGLDKHLICQVFREDTKPLGIAGFNLQEIPSDKVLKELSCRVGNCAIQLGIELGVSFDEVENSLLRFPKDLTGLIEDILKKWKEKSKIKTFLSLMLALIRVKGGGVQYLLRMSEEMLIQHGKSTEPTTVT
ncbi:uncharacterized protein LOC134709993 [Mytilus trossulus]|uniref:uncharacterized protein LOC134709993 n=1 Tax=Mytilus trossulus TaxID=6551 RepID=UPI00300433D3